MSSNGSDQSGGDWVEYRRLVMRDLSRLEQQLNAIVRDTDGVRGTIITMGEQVGQLREHLEQYTKKLEEHEKTIHERVGGVEKRVSHNEKALANVQGRAAGLGAVTGGGLLAIFEALRHAIGL
jgi:hypothetical protein